jgi:hypothetical protein
MPDGYYLDDPDYVDWLNELVENAPSHYDGDEAQEAIVLRYVRDMEAVVAEAKNFIECGFMTDRWKAAREKLSDALRPMMECHCCIPGGPHDHANCEHPCCPDHDRFGAHTDAPTEAEEAPRFGRTGVES